MSGEEEFEGLPVYGHSLAVKGLGDGLSAAMAVTKPSIRKGDTVYLLVKAVAGAVKFVPDKKMEAWESREQTLVAETIAIVDAEFAEDRIEQQREAENRRKGIVKLPGMGRAEGVEVVVDENGVVLTEAEIAERRGDGRPVVSTSPVIVQFDDNDTTRRMWPDEFDKGDARPDVGDICPDGVVTALIDPESGAVLAGTSEGVAAVDDDLSGELYPSTEGGSDDALTDAPSGDTHGAPDVDGWEDPDPATAERIAAADHDPAVVEWLSVSTAEVKANVAANSSAQWLRQALAVESNGPNKPRGAVVNALSARLEELGS